MKKRITNLYAVTTILSFLLWGLSITEVQGQIQHQTKSNFWDKVQFGGGLGLGFGSNYTNITVAPSAIYNFNQYVSAGLGVQYSYAKQKEVYDSHMYGGSIIGLFNPVQQVQLSAELEQLRVNNSYDSYWGGGSYDFWNTALFLGAGYRTSNVIIGVRYNVLYNNDDNSPDVYGTDFMPFVRVYF